ncbi:aminodeoxychorismate/anthranilate synthase component II [Candidatus Daviesbacteria bacterium]|nr:aminodeoxychorismate/anthranilate synthase component II [Candidatus Daviesbacteria bacterium]
MKVLLIDNYDSFTYNLCQLVGQILEEKGEKFSLEVLRNDEISLRQIQKRGYEKIIISPGPGDPSDKKYFGICAQVLTKLGRTIPVLGVCLGMQGLGYYYGGKVSRAGKIMHGKTSIITHAGRGLFKGLPQDLEVMRYHSLVVERENLPKDLEILATSEDGEIMGLAHKKFTVSGVQFHPESFATEGGKKILENFLLN